VRGKIVEEQLSPSDIMIESLDNKEETTYRSAKERNSTEKYKRMTRYLNNMVTQKEDRETVCGTHPSSPCREGEAKASTSR
jgi:hypothetical protein